MLLRLREQTPHNTREQQWWLQEFTGEGVDLAAVDAFLTDFRSLLSQEPATWGRGRINLVVDLSNAGVPQSSFECVQRIVAFLAETSSARAEHCGKTVIVAPSATLRTLILSVSVLQPPCTPMEIVREWPSTLQRVVAKGEEGEWAPWPAAARN